MGRVQWSPDGSQLAFVSTSRTKRAWLRLADRNRGGARGDAGQQPHLFESGYNQVTEVPPRVERISGTGTVPSGASLLYDLQTARLKTRSPPASGTCLGARVDPRSARLSFWARGGSRGIRISGTSTGSSSTAAVSRRSPRGRRSPGFDFAFGRYFGGRLFEARCAAGEPVAEPGKTVMTLSRRHFRLVATGWKPPISVTVKARDGKTICTPAVPAHNSIQPQYPLINGSIRAPRPGAWGAGAFRRPGATPRRSPSSACGGVHRCVGTRCGPLPRGLHGNMGDNGLPDQVAG